MKAAKFPVMEFKRCNDQKDGYSSWVCFCRTVKGRDGLSKRTIRKNFDKLVEKNDYDITDRKALLKNLYELSENIVR